MFAQSFDKPYPYARQTTKTKQNAMKKPLAAFRYLTRQNVAAIGRKSIMRVETARMLQWWLILPAIGDNDNPCILIRKAAVTKFDRNQTINRIEPGIIAEETARAAANAA